MSRTLASWQVENYTGGGSVAYVRYSFNQTFQDSDGLTHLRGSWKENYIEDECTVADTVVTIPTHASFPTTDDVPVNQQSSCTAVLLDENRRNPITLFSGWIIPSGVGDPITRTALVTRNEARQELRDRETYSASVIDAKLAQVGLTSAPKATDAIYGVVRTSVTPATIGAPVAVGDNDPRMLGIVEKVDGIRFAKQFQFSTVSNTAVSSIGVADPTTAPSLALSAGGTLTQDQPYWVRYAWVTASGVTAVSPEARIVTTAANKTITATVPAIPAGATGWAVYVSSVMGQQTKQGATIVAVTAYAFSSTPTTNGDEYQLINTTAPTTITPTSMSKIYSPVVYAQNDANTMKQPLLVDAGTGQEEVVYVVSKTATSFTATFTKTHSAGFAIQSATGGIAEAVMDISIGNAGGTNENGGIVYMPSGLTITKAPIEFRQSVHFRGKQGLPYTAIDGGNPAAQGSQVHYTGTDPTKGAFQNVAVSLTNRMGDVSFSDFTISSDTNGIYLGGAAGIFGLSVHRMAIYSTPSTAGFSAVKIETSEPQFLSFDKASLYGFHCLYYRGGNMFGWSMTNCILFGRGTTGTHLYLDSAYSGGQALGGSIKLTNTITEYGGGTVIYLNATSLFLDGFGIADWVPATPTSNQIVVDQTTINGSINSFIDIRNSGLYQGGTSGPCIKVQSSNGDIVRATFNIQNCFFFGTWAAGLIDFGDVCASPITLFNNTNMDTRIGLTGTEQAAVFGLGEPNTFRKLFTAFNNTGVVGNSGVELGNAGTGLILHGTNGKNFTLTPTNSAANRTYTIPDFAADDSFVGVAATQTLTNKTLTSPALTTPTIASFVNATHNHQNAAGGGGLDAAAIGSGTLANARVNFAAPSAIGSGTPAAGSFTTISATGQVTSTLATGTAPMVVASTTKVDNLNVDKLDGKDWADPGAIGGGTPSTIAATTIAGTAITGTTSVTSPIHAMSAAEGAGTFVEQLLALDAAVNMNTGTATTLFTCPASRSCIITKVIIDLASTSLTTASCCFGWVSAGFNDVIVTATHTTLTGATLYEIVPAKVGARIGTAAETFKVLNTILQGAAATCRMRIFGIVFTP